MFVNADKHFCTFAQTLKHNYNNTFTASTVNAVYVKKPLQYLQIYLQYFQ